jgi:hypothetical protein
MPGIPPALDTDTEDVTWALQTAEALWRRDERLDALVWLRRAAQAAGEMEQDDRALELAHDAAELAEWIDAAPPSGSLRGPADDLVDALRSRETDETDDVSVEIVVEAGESAESTPALGRDRMDTPTLPDEPIESSPPASIEPFPPTLPAARSPLPPRVPSAAEKHAGMLDPWADGEARAPAPHVSPAWSAHAAAAFDQDEVVTSAPMMPRANAGRAIRDSPFALQLTARADVDGARRSFGAAAIPSPPSSRSSATRVDLSGVDALSDLPDDARETFARAAVVHELACDEEVSGFALALVLEGTVDLAATIVDTPAQRIDVGTAIRSRGTIDHIAPVRLVAASQRAWVATWDERAVEIGLRACPWVDDDLRAAGDRLQALVGATMGPLGERLDPFLRAHVASKLTLRALAEHEVVAARGKPVPGLLVVGAGELELVGEDGVPEGPVLRAGDFVFPDEVLIAGPAPSTVRAAKGGALVLFADRHAAQELLVTCPPLLEIFAGM